MAGWTVGEWILPLTIQLYRFRLRIRVPYTILRHKLTLLANRNSSGSQLNTGVSTHTHTNTQNVQQCVPSTKEEINPNSITQTISEVQHSGKDHEPFCSHSSHPCVVLSYFKSIHERTAFCIHTNKTETKGRSARSSSISPWVTATF